MKKEWVYEGKKYIIYDDRDGNLYLNCHLCDCAEIFENIDHPNGKIVRHTKRQAKELLTEIENKIVQEKTRKAKIIAQYEKEKIKKQRLHENVFGFFVFLLCLGIIGAILYFIFQLWWIFVGDWAFNGPWANDVSGGEVAFETIIFFIALIVVIEEVIRRCINGHF